jgi:hypothetical protein
MMMVLIGALSTVCTLISFMYWLLISSSESLLYLTTSLTVSLFAWGMVVIQKSMPKDSSYTKYTAPLSIFLVIAAVTLYNPMALHQMWIVFLFFPIMLSLLTDFKVYKYGSIIYLLCFFFFHIYNQTNKFDGLQPPVIAVTMRGILALGAVLLGGIILITFNEHKKRLEERSFQQQKQQVINILQCFIPVGERKTQTSRKEIGEMSVLLKALVSEFGGIRVQDWEIDLLSLLHFVSRVKLPDYMFEKEGKLSEFEFEVVQEHCFMAKELCQGIPHFQDIEKTFLYHHEKIDGTGYPYRLSGDQVPSLSQMLGLVEVFQAMTTPRSYKQAMSKREAYAEIQKLSGSFFRADIVDSFGRVIPQIA